MASRLLKTGAQPSWLWGWRASRLPQIAGNGLEAHLPHRQRCPCYAIRAKPRSYFSSLLGSFEDECLEFVPLRRHDRDAEHGAGNRHQQGCGEGITCACSSASLRPFVAGPNQATLRRVWISWWVGKPAWLKRSRAAPPRRRGNFRRYLERIAVKGVMRMRCHHARLCRHWQPSFLD